jgi:hypothetical protein
VISEDFAMLKRGRGYGGGSFLSWIISLCDLEPSYCQLLKRGSVEINFYMGINDAKGKKSQRLRRIEDFISYLSLTSSILSRGIHWMSWCSANHQKYISPPKTPIRPDISGPLAGFQRLWSDMSGP